MTDEHGIEEAQFLVHSPHRIEILRALRDGPRTRGELTERTDVSRVTIGRSLGEMTERKWVVRTDGQYRILPLGEAVIAATEAFVRTLSTGRQLRDVVEYLPVAELDFDLARLVDATVVRTTRHDNSAVIRRYRELLAETTELWVLKDAVDMEMVRAVSDRIDAGDLDACVVYSPEAVDTTKRIPEAQELMLRDLANGKRAFSYPGHLTYHLAVLDGTVLLFLRDDRGVSGLVETGDPVVHDWAMRTVRAVREDAEPLDASSFRVDGRAGEHDRPGGRETG